MYLVCVLLILRDRNESLLYQHRYISNFQIFQMRILNIRSQYLFQSLRMFFRIFRILLVYDKLFASSTIPTKTLHYRRRIIFNYRQWFSSNIDQLLVQRYAFCSITVYFQSNILLIVN